MNYKQRRARRATLFGAAVGVLIIITYVITLVAPDLGSSNSSSSSLDNPQQVEPTQIRIPEPIANPQIGGNPPFVHSTGYFQTLWPAGADWYLDSAPADATTYGAVFKSGQQVAVLHTYISQGVSYDSLESLSQDYLTESYFAQVWSGDETVTGYENWTETGRQITDNAVVTYFDLKSQGASFLARDITRIDGNWLVVARIVVPANNLPLMNEIGKLIVPSFFIYHDLLNLPAEWPTYVDQASGFMIKYPQTWERVAGRTGENVTVKPVANENFRILAWAVPDQSLASAEDAAAWVVQTEPTASVLQTVELQHEFGGGYAVSYRYQDEAGALHSGLMALLNDSNNNLMVARLRVKQSDVDLLNADGLSSELSEARQIVLEGFIALPIKSRAQVAEASAPDGRACTRNRSSGCCHRRIRDDGGTCSHGTGDHCYRSGTVGSGDETTRDSG